MNILFCSNVHGQTGTTTNMLMTAVLSDILYDKTCILLQTQVSLNQLEIPMIERENRNEVLKKYPNMEKVIGSIIKKKYTDGVLKRSCIPLSNTSMSFIHGNYVEDKEEEKEEMNEALHKIFASAERLYEMVFVDVGIIGSQISDFLYEKADWIIVCLNQNQRVLDDYFMSNHVRDKVLYMIGMYDKDSMYSIDYLLKNYPMLNEKNTFFMPYNTEVRDAVSESKLSTYFYKNIICEREDVNYEFVNAALKFVRHINCSD